MQKPVSDAHAGRRTLRDPRVGGPGAAAVSPRGQEGTRDVANRNPRRRGAASLFSQCVRSVCVEEDASQKVHHGEEGVFFFLLVLIPIM